MTNDVLWLVRLGLDQGLFTSAQANAVRAAVGDAADLVNFAQKLIDDGLCEKIDALEKVCGLALTKGQKGPPASNPFEAGETTAPFRAPPPPLRDASYIDHPPSESQNPESSGPGPAPRFPFEQVAAMAPEAVAAGMRSLLRATARHGASDLHLSTGSRPFIRKERALSFLSSHTLTPDASSGTLAMYVSRMA